MLLTTVILTSRVVVTTTAVGLTTSGCGLLRDTEYYGMLTNVSMPPSLDFSKFW